MAEYLTPALIATLIAVVGFIGRRGLAQLSGLAAVVAVLVSCHLHRHPEDMGKFTLGMPAPLP